MIVVPAVDIRDGKCVRLVQGDYARETVFHADPAEAAKRWEEAGAELVHVVDLDGAREGRPVNVKAIRAIRKAIDAAMEVGGGIRDEETIREMLSEGADRVILGTRAIEDPAWVKRAAARFPGSLLVGIDALEGKVRARGWLATSDKDATELARQLTDAELAGVIVTDISRDGTLAGPNVALALEVAEAAGKPAFASGGVSGLADILTVARSGLAGVIVGKALYDGRVDLREAIRAVRAQCGGTQEECRGA
ncbi:MAG: 1-(5-phosphoribosyl)-5-[(5-phosphoribosylamino)methylideneamino]imidazole-4-carboxamide isomerase [Planctomycetota bacterium]